MRASGGVAAAVVAALVALVLAVGLTVFAAIHYSGDGEDERATTSAPAFSTEQLQALPADGRITNGPTLANQR